MFNVYYKDLRISEKSKIITKTKEAPRIWLGRPAENMLMVPVKFEATYRFGVLRIYLTGLLSNTTVEHVE